MRLCSGVHRGRLTPEPWISNRLHMKKKLCLTSQTTKSMQIISWNPHISSFPQNQLLYQLSSDHAFQSVFMTGNGIQAAWSISNFLISTKGMRPLPAMGMLPLPHCYGCWSMTDRLSFPQNILPHRFIPWFYIFIQKVWFTSQLWNITSNSSVVQLPLKKTC